jgi:hypothetical protein
VIDLGDVVGLFSEVRTPDGVLQDAGAATLTITLPDGTTTNPAPDHPSTGVYQFDFATTQPGLHRVRWQFTGANAGVDSDVFNVAPATPVALIGLDEAKAHLNMSATVTASDRARDDELRGWIETVTAIVEDDPEVGVGPCATRTVVERHSSGQAVWLHRPPVLSLTSVVPVLTSGSAVSVGDLDVDGDTGEVRRLDGAPLTGGPWTVTYQAGRRVVPAPVTGAAKAILKHLWETQRGPARLPVLGGDDVVMTASGYAIPHRAARLLAGLHTPRGFA